MTKMKHLSVVYGFIQVCHPPMILPYYGSQDVNENTDKGIGLMYMIYHTSRQYG